jgi:hypothetical protein
MFSVQVRELERDSQKTSNSFNKACVESFLGIGSVGHPQTCSIMKGASEGVMRWLSGDDSRDMWPTIGSSVGSVLPLTQTIPWGR